MRKNLRNWLNDWDIIVFFFSVYFPWFCTQLLLNSKKRKLYETNECAVIFDFVTRKLKNNPARNFTYALLESFLVNGSWIESSHSYKPWNRYNGHYFVYPVFRYGSINLKKSVFRDLDLTSWCNYCIPSNLTTNRVTPTRCSLTHDDMNDKVNLVHKSSYSFHLSFDLLDINSSL